MAEECTHDCSSCGAACSSRQEAQDMTEKLNPYTQEFGVLKFVTDFIEEETNVWVNHHTSAYIGTTDVPGWVGEFLPHFESRDSGKFLGISPTRGPEWMNIPDPDIETLMPDRWKTLLNSAANAVGDHLHHAFISVDSNGNATFGRAERLFWEWTFIHPSVTATSEDISNGYVDFVFPLGETGMRICENGNLITIKGFELAQGNILNGKQLTFLLRGTSGSPTIILDSGFSTYTESIVNNYQWKAFKSFGLTSNRNVSHFNAVLRVPIESSTEPGTEIEFEATITISMFGVASNDTIS